ncbi:MAG: UvrD-helicase domain-containing protein [Gemmatimonadota bacterium]|nr:UvrD-helicase domain-containing protein [Gemmatimonadota bacterium]
MVRMQSLHSVPGESMGVGRSGLGSYVFRFLRPGHAGAVSLKGETLILERSSGSVVVPIREIETSEVIHGWFWGGLQVRFASGNATVSGLSKPDARSFGDFLLRARVDWWCVALDTHAGTIQSVYDRLAQFADPPRYVSHAIFSPIERDAKDVVARFPAQWPEQLSEVAEIRMLKAIQDFSNESKRCRARACNAFVANELVRSREFFDRVEARPLTDEQRRAVVVDEDRNLVVAAAGSGKTSVIVAKAGWLIRKGYRRPSELLLLAFAKDAQEEMKERVRKRLGVQLGDELTVRTFHSLGMSIIGEAERRRPAVARAAVDDQALFDLLKGIVRDLIADPGFSEVMLKWFAGHFAPYRSEFEFRTQGAYWAYLRDNEIRSLQGEKVKSFEECEIANFLYLNGVPYEYERDYEHETATPDKRQYQPDFYLPDAGIYIEHLALSESNQTPPFIDRGKYLRSLGWKRRLHAKHGTVLVETYSHEKVAGRLTENLAEKLADHGVTLSPIPSGETFSVLEEQGRIEPFTRLVATFLHHYKGAQLSADDVARRAAGAENRPRAEAFLTVFIPVYERYQESLARRRQIDFHDMITNATEHVRRGRYRNRFGYILVDEFQDISAGRAGLLKALLDTSSTAQLFAVGDDWQAIFRFAGSDIAIMREFTARFGESERVNLETTFRCADRIANLASRFVLSNPAQIHKRVSSIFNADGPCVHVMVARETSPDPLAETLNAVAADAAGDDERATVLLLGRYRHNRPGNLETLSRAHSSLRLTFMTVHGSKGLEADYVVVLDLCSGKYGFPTGIDDDPLLDLVLAAPEAYPNAEERRLFYVAVTRARRGVYLVADNQTPSAFVEELMKDGYDVVVHGEQPERDVPCPKCIHGRLEQRGRAQDRGIFYGCSLWPYCEYRQPACPHCRAGLQAKVDGNYRCRDCRKAVEGCPECFGWLLEKRGKYGRFIGCSNWPDCRFTRNDPKKRTGRSSVFKGIGRNRK